MKTQIINLLASGQKMSTTEIAQALGSINRVVYPILCALGSKSEVRRISAENGSFGVSTQWIAFN